MNAATTLPLDSGALARPGETDVLPAQEPHAPPGHIEDHTGHQAPMGHAKHASIYDLDDTQMGKFAAKLHNTASCIALPLMTVFICSEVIMRYIFNSALFWSQEACGICMFVLVLCCQANCWQKDRHIRMDLLYNWAPNWFKRVTDVLTIISGIIFFGAICWQAFRDVPYQFAVNEATDEMYIPLWLLSGIVILSCILLLSLLLRYSFRLFGRQQGGLS